MNIEIPELLPYPPIYDIKDNFNIFNKMYCYVIDKYNINDGCNLYIGFRDEYQFVRISDFSGNVIDHKDYSDNDKIIMSYVDKLSNLMKLSKIIEMSFYFSYEDYPILVDVMVSINKMLSPGMLRDLFSKVVKTQQVHSIEVIDESILDKFNIILKPSRFKYMFDKNGFSPLYGIM